MSSLDICIIGAGSAGLSVAAVAAQMDLNVCLIEADKMGGECLNTGCVPSKALLAAAKIANQFRHAEPYGIKSIEPEIDFKKVMEYVHQVVAKIEPHDSKSRFEGLGARVILGEAKFIDENSILVDGENIRAKQFVIATGSKPVIPQIDGIEQVNYYTNETIFNLKEKPQHLVIIGGGAIGCEMAQAFCYLGCKVTVLEALTILPRDDQELVGMLKQKLEADGIQFLEKVMISHIQQKGETIVLTYKADKQVEIECTHVLVAAGRKPNIANLNLEAAGIDFNHKGIIVDQHLKTTNKKVYAIGDVVGPYQFTHMASYQAGIAIRQLLFRLPVKVDYRAVPWVTYTHPELAHVGLQEKEAQSQYKNIKILTFDFSENDRAQTEGETLGKIKVFVQKNGRILGVNILGVQAGELITPWIAAIKRKQKLKQMLDYIIPYPTLSEMNKSVANEFYKPLLFSKWMKRIVKFLV